MIRARFRLHHGAFRGFSLNGHAGLSVAGQDVLCAAVSGMTMLVINTLETVLGAELQVREAPEGGSIDVGILRISDENRSAAESVLKGFFLQLSDLEKQYPDNLSVTTQKEKG